MPENPAPVQAQAILQAKQAIANAPHDAEAWHKLGWEHEARGELEEAVTCYSRAVQFKPLADGSYNNLGNCLNALGHFDEAYAAWRTAIQLAPGCSMYYRNLVQSKALAPDDPCFESLEAQIRQAARLPASAQADLFFAYGQTLAEQGEHEFGFAQILRANAVYRPTFTYDENTVLSVSAQLPKLFTRDVMREKRGLGDPSEIPVFVIGMPRSGSTLVEQILASHPQIGGVGERTDFDNALSWLLSTSRAQPTGAFSLDKLSEATPAQLHGLGSNYLQRLAQAVHASGEAGPARVVNKYQYNFIHAGLIHLALPNARIIHVRRSPLDTCLSIYSRWFHDVPFGYDLGELGRYYRAYDTLMAHWRTVLPEDVMLEVSYEELVADTEGEARRLLAHCGMEWDARCLEFYRTKRSVTTASAAQVRKPIYRTSIRRWRPDLRVLRPLLEGLGPELAATVQ
ncbi:sulfotransferase [Paraburkholderia sp. B3]|uniref:sulfotransferase family protein n=1 Tax=Paraburkholderia sp. B3 TaxID=3134791 RepID=UPI0039825461